MAFQACVTDQYLQDLPNGVHCPDDTYMIALYQQANATDKNRATTVYTPIGEVTGAGYTAGGQVLTGFTVGIVNDTAYLNWTTNPQWTGASFTADSCIIYNASENNNVLAIFSFGSTTVVAGTFTIQMPANGLGATLTYKQG